MQQLADWYFALLFIVTLVGFVVAALLFFIHQTKLLSARLLAFFIVGISAHLFNHLLQDTQFFLTFPNCWRLAIFISCSFPPLGYLYVRTVLQQSYGLKKWDILLWIPAIVFTIVGVPSVLDHLPFALFGTILSVAQYLLLFQWKRKLKWAPNNYLQNLATYRWLIYFSSMGALVYGLSFILIYFQLTSFLKIWHSIIFLNACTILLIVGYIWRKPNILYGFTGWFYQSKEQANTTASETQKLIKPFITLDAPNNSLSLEQSVVYKLQLENHFLQKQPYLKKRYSIKDLSKELGIPAIQLSSFIVQEYGKNFHELVRNFRVNYLHEVYKNSK